MTYSSDVAFTPTVKAIQTRKGSRHAYSRQEHAGAWQTEITEDLKGFIEAQTSAFLATANADGQPYIYLLSLAGKLCTVVEAIGQQVFWQSRFTDHCHHQQHIKVAIELLAEQDQQLCETLYMDWPDLAKPGVYDCSGWR